MIPQGFLGSRADLLTDLALLLFIILPMVMPAGFRLARKGSLRQHRGVQLAFLATMSIAVAALEVDIRLKGGTGTLAGNAAAAPAALIRALFIIHLAIAVTTWTTWIGLVVKSWRRFESTLPGAFSRAHKLWGRRVWLGVSATAATGTLLYIAVYVR